MLKDETAAILEDAARIAHIRQEIKTISDEDLPVLPESLFSVTLNYKQFVQVLGALMRGAHVAETRVMTIAESPTLKAYARLDQQKIESALSMLEELPASAIRVEMGV